MKVTQMRNAKGVPVKNQFILDGVNKAGNVCKRFQSYDSIIVEIEQARTDSGIQIVTYLDKLYWDYSRTTSKYRSLFLGETTDETKKKIKSGEYQLVNLNV